MSEEQVEQMGEAVEAATPVEAQEEQSVPLTALQAERAQRQQKEQELEIIRQQMALMAANNHQKQAQPDDEDDILTKKEMKQYMKNLQSQYEYRLGEMEMARKHPDYEEVVTKYLPEVIQNNPRIRQTLEMTQDYELAYNLAKSTEGYRNATQSKKKNADAERILKNSSKPGSLSSVGTSTPISDAKRYRDMPVDEFQELMKRNLGQI